MAGIVTPSYRIGYLNALKEQQANEAYNLEANVIFQETGKLMGTLEDPITIQAGNTEQMRALIKQYLGNQIVPEDIDSCISPLSAQMVEWIYDNLSTVKSVLQKTFGGVPAQCVQFKSLIKELASGSEGDPHKVVAEAEKANIDVTGMGPGGTHFGTVPTVGSQLPTKGKRKEKIDGGIIGHGLNQRALNPSKAAFIMPGAGRAFKFREFGKYVVDLEKLKDNELQIKYKNGKKVARIEPKIMGGDLAQIVKRVSKGEKPSRVELAKLSTEEKTYLEHIRKEAQVAGLDEVSDLVRSSKNRERHEFEKMKGQILAGNDNPTMVRQFKTMLVKLTNNKQLPEKQGKGLLMDLAAMGL